MIIKHFEKGISLLMYVSSLKGNTKIRQGQFLKNLRISTITLNNTIQELTDLGHLLVLRDLNCKRFIITHSGTVLVNLRKDIIKRWLNAF